MKSNSKEKPVRKNVATYLLLVLEPAPGSARVVGQREGKLSSPVPDNNKEISANPINCVNENGMFSPSIGCALLSRIPAPQS